MRLLSRLEKLEDKVLAKKTEPVSVTVEFVSTERGGDGLPRVTRRMRVDLKTKAEVWEDFEKGDGND